MGAFEFYENLAVYNDFSGLTSESNFVEVPEDWWVVLTDVRGSTAAIKAGRYQQVNMTGASTITAVLNLLGTSNFPYVFGGDGATLLVPEQYLELVAEELSRLQTHSINEFELELRVGLVSIKELHQQGYSLRLGKYELSPGNYLAQFRGNGLTRAEDMVKKCEPGARIIEPNPFAEKPNLEGLSCRLNPIASQKGKILSFLAKPLGANDQELQSILVDLLRDLKSIMNDDFKSVSPVRKEGLSWKLVPTNWRQEAANRRGEKGGFARAWAAIKKILIANLMIKFNISGGGFVPEKYKSELVQNSDFQKFDETLRMVIDCTTEQAAALEILLEEYRLAGRLMYGVHYSDRAIMTCVVFSASNNQHVHFVDGADGGYALAAVGLKKQIKG